MWRFSRKSSRAVILYIDAKIPRSSAPRHSQSFLEEYPPKMDIAEVDVPGNFAGPAVFARSLPWPRKCVAVTPKCMHAYAEIIG
jgi:hypothetical protein